VNWPSRFRIRPAQPGDEAAAYRVCLLTGDAGKDATAIHPDEPDLLGHVYVGAYLKLEPELAFLLEDDEGVCGYVLGALDSREFYRRYEAEWLPPLQARIPAPGGEAANWSPTDQLRHLIHAPDLFCPEPYAEFPAHLHIDLLPRAQGQGMGRRMMDTLLARLTELGSPGVHLGMHATNTRAQAFYTKLGFHELVRVGESLYLGRRLAV
jgi:ribosomal protein S18 acetylase RimI-like enzyme